MKRHFRLTVLLSVVATACGGAKATEPADVEPPVATPDQEATVVLASEVEWQWLNPARGDLAPQAATLWGDRNGAGPTGFLLKPKDGFESPPHIHNVSYRGVVISGLIHNADPSAETQWMPAGSYWTQPKGDVHITSAEGENTLAYIEIDEGPYLVTPLEEAFVTEEPVINTDASKIEWTDVPSPQPFAKRTALWRESGGAEPSGSLLMISAGKKVILRSDGKMLRAVVIKGRPTLGGKILEPGSLLSATGPSESRLTTVDGDVVLYVRTDGPFDLALETP